MRGCNVHQINSLIASLTAMQVNQVGRHTPLSTQNDLFDGMKARPSVQTQSTISASNLPLNPLKRGYLRSAFVFQLFHQCMSVCVLVLVIFYQMFYREHKHLFYQNFESSLSLLFVLFLVFFKGCKGVENPQ